MWKPKWINGISIIIFCIVIPTVVNGKNKLIRIDEIYKSAVKAYSEDRWSECIRLFEDTIHLNKLYKSVMSNCGQRCKEKPYNPIVPEKIEELTIYELYLRRSECMRNCKNNGLKELDIDGDVTETVKDFLADLQPYNYIHMCYFKMNSLPNAASAAYTYMIAHPDDTTMKKNYQYYIRQPEVDEDEIIDLESDDYKFLYWQGVEANERKQWAECVSTMEEVLDDYFASENKCRLSCEENNNKNLLGEFDDLASYFIYVLDCKQKCQNSVRSMQFKSGINFIADILNHIQIGYYHLDEQKKAARAVQSYLLLIPDDEEMLENKKIYTSFIQPDSFVEKPEIVFYHKRDTYEKQLLKHFQTTEDDSSN